MKEKFPTKMTSIELKVKAMLESLNIPFVMHKVVMGITQPDFFTEPNICIYADGDYWHSQPSTIERDKKIDVTLKMWGYKILRLKENIINQQPAIVEEELKEVIKNS